MIIREVADPLSAASLRSVSAIVPGSFIESDALDVLAAELNRYCNQEIVGRSFLISGHRGAGKTTIVQHAFRRVLDGATAGKLKLRPLYVHLHGPSLFPDSGRSPQPSSVSSVVSRMLTNAPPAADSVAGVVTTANPVRRSPDTSSSSSTTVAPTGDAGASSATRDARVALEQITLALHRAASREFADAVWRRAGEISQSPSRDAGFVEKMLWSDTVSGARQGEFAELAAAFEYELQECPTPARLRDYWAKLDALRVGVLNPANALRSRNADWVDGQGMRELVALSSVCDAHRRITGELKQSDSASEDATHKLEATLSGDMSGKTVGTLMASILTGALVGGGLALGKTSPLVSTMAGLLSALGSSVVFKWSTTHARNRAIKRDYEFIRDNSIATLDRQLPVLLERLLAAGLAPVFVVDELDKVDDLSDRIFGMVRHLKKLVAESAFFCFLTDRAYFEEMRSRGEHRAYPLEYSYFTHRLFVSNTADSLHKYLGYMLDEVSEVVEYPLIRYMLLHRSEMHSLELHRLLRSLRKPSGDVGLDLNELRRRPSYRIDIALQLGVEIVLDDDDLRDRIRDEPDFQRLVHDALLYPSRKWADGQAVIEFSPETRQDFVDYLIARMNRTEATGFIERRRRSDPSRTVHSRRTRAEVIDEGDLDTLWAKVQELVLLLSENGNLEQRFGDWNSRRVSRGMTPVDRTVAEQALGVGNSPFERDPVSPTRFKWRYDRYGVDQVRRSEQANREAATARMRAAVSLIEAFSQEISRAQASGENQVPALDALDFEALIDTYRILPTSRGWSSVQDSMRTLAGRTLGEADRSLDDHARNVEAFAAMIGANAELIGYTLACTVLLTRLVPRSELRPTQVVLGRLSSVYNFRALSTDGVLACFKGLWAGVRGYMEARAAVPAAAGPRLGRRAPGRSDDHLGRGSVPKIRTAADVSTFNIWVHDALQYARDGAPKLQAARAAAQTDAWASVVSRYEDALVGRPSRTPEVAELICGIAGDRPFADFSVPLEQTPVASWVRLLSPALISREASFVALPAWVHGLAAHALGFRSTTADAAIDRFLRLAGISTSTEKDGSDGPPVTPPSDEERAIRNFLDAHPALIVRTAVTDVISVLKRENSVVDQWPPTSRAAVVAFSPKQLEMLGPAMDRRLFSDAKRYILAVELPADNPVSSSSWIPVIRRMHASKTRPPTFETAEFGPLTARPTSSEHAWAGEAKSFDHFMDDTGGPQGIA